MNEGLLYIYVHSSSTRQTERQRSCPAGNPHLNLSVTVFVTHSVHIYTHTQKMMAKLDPANNYKIVRIHRPEEDE